MIFLTGATGYVGRNLLPLLLKADANETLVALVRKRPDYDLERVEWVVGDLFTDSVYAHYIGQADAIIHLAGCISPPTVEEYFQVNVLGTRRLLFAAQNQGCPRVIYLSSYDAVCNQKGSYGKSKKMAEKEILDSKLRFTIIRPTVIYGGQGRSGLFPILRLIRKGPFVPIIGSGRQLLQPLYVGDLCQTMISVLKDFNNYSQAFVNIGGPEKLNWLEVVKYLGRRESVSTVPIPIPRSLLLLGLAPLTFFDRPKILAEKFASLSQDKVIGSAFYKDTQGFTRLSSWAEVTSEKDQIHMI